MVRTLGCWLLIALILTFNGSGFSQNSNKGTVELSGKVTNIVTGEPVSRALVEVQVFEARRPGALEAGNLSVPSAVRMFTDASGGFLFSGLPIGFASISVARPYFQSHTERIQLEGGAKSLQIGITKLGVVAGTVTDAEGRPVPGVNVVLYQTSIVSGRRSLSQSRNVATDDIGHYRLWNLSPGKYFLKAAGRGRGTMLYSSEVLPSFSAAESFVPVFYGGSKTLETATPIDLRSSSDVTADFRISLEPVRKIRGTVTGMTLFRNATFQLFDKQENLVASRAALSGAAGSFELLDVLPGSYVVRVTQGSGDAQVYGEAEVTVGAEDVEGVKLPLRSGVDITLKSECRVKLNEQMEMPCGGLTLFRADGSMIQPTFDKDIIYKNLAPGQYGFEVKIPGMYATTVLVGGQVIRPGDKLRVFDGMGAVEMLSGKEGGTIEVKVEVASEMQPGDIQFLVVPTMESYSGPTLAFAGANQFFKYAPGEYLIYALHATDMQELEYHNPEALRALTPAASLRVEANGHHTVTIRSLSK